MRLRRTSRLPGRYREDDIPPLPGIAKFVHPTIPFNPNLRPAAFPTLALSDTFEAMEARKTQDAEPTPVRKAAVFRDKRLSLDSQSSTDEWLESYSLTQSRGGVIMDENEERAIEQRHDDGREHGNYRARDDWGQVTPGLKVIVIMELTTAHTLQEATDMLNLTEYESEEVKDLLVKQIIRLENEESLITSSQARQLDMLMSESIETSSETFSRILSEDLYANLEDPESFTIKKTDLAHAKAYLTNLNLASFADRLWRYEGVALSSETFGFLGALLDQHLSTRYGNIPTAEDLENMEAEDGEIVAETRKKRKYIRRKPVLKRSASPMPEPETPAPKRRGTVKLRNSTGLRTSISAGDLTETFATSPAALQPDVYGFSFLQAPPVSDQRAAHKVSKRPTIRFMKKNRVLAEESKDPAEKDIEPAENNEVRLHNNAEDSAEEIMDVAEDMEPEGFFESALQ